MNDSEHQRRRDAVRKSLVGAHDAWVQASDAGNLLVKHWLLDVADVLVAAAFGETVEFVETIGPTTAGAELQVIAFSASRRIDVRTTAPHGNTGSTITTTVKGRRGLLEASLLNLKGNGGETWPRSLTVHLRYADGDQLTLGDWRGGREGDWAAPEALIDFYPTLLADLNRP